MPEIVNTIKGSIKVVGLLEEGCTMSAQEFLLALQNMLAVEIPIQTISNVIISNQQPGSENQNALWVQQANSGVVLGVRVYSQGKWVQLFPAPDQVFWLKGDSRVPPAGYRFIEPGSGAFTTAEYAKLMTNAIFANDNPSSGYYVYYPALFVGV